MIKEKSNYILFSTGIFPPDIGGPASYVPKISKKMISDGIVPIVICYSNVSNHISDKDGYMVIRIRRSKIFLIHYIKYFFAVLKYGKRVDLIYLQNYFSAGLPTLLANIFLKKRTILKIVGIFSREQSRNFGFTNLTLDEYVNNNKIIFKIIKGIEKRIINKIDKVITPSNYMKGLLKSFGIEKPIIVIYNSFDPFDYSYIKKEKKKRDLGINNDQKVFLYVGRLVNRKNLDKLIYAFSKNKKDHLLIIGDGPEYNKLQNIINHSGQEEQIKLLGSKSKNDVYSFYQIADTFVLISNYEGMSHVLLEAIYMNLNIISSNIKPNVETLAGYKNTTFISLETFKEMPQIKTKTNKDKDNVLKKYNFHILYNQLKKELGI